MGNKLKPLSPPPPVRSNEELSMRAEHLGSIVERVEAKTKCDNSVAEINHQLVVLQNSLTRIENVVSKFNSCQSTIDKHIASIGSLNESVGSAVVNIEKAIDKAGKVKVTIRLDPKHLQQLEAYKQDIVEQEKKVREDFFLKEEESASGHYNAIHNLMTNNEGSWLSKDTFFVWMAVTFVLAGVLLTIFAVWLASLFK